MRFASLSLERYGHFTDCELSFRAGAPDLHIIYGANEAGKTTSMAAVSDLLFGFPARSPYNFVYDYALLRIGAVLQEGERSLACRRKKGTGATLLDADDRQLDEGALLAMLRGQTRETFCLSFSLNQEGLRDGGRAMVEARNDLGRALFAAGSGLTDVSDALSKLETEADAIWGVRAAARRSFTRAQRDLETSSRAVRDQSLKPKTWIDARNAVAAKLDAFSEAQRVRDAVLAEVSRIERIRRIAPSARLRADHLATLQAHSATVDILAHREAAAVQAMAEAEAAGRAKAAAERLVAEAGERIATLNSDPSILEHAQRIDDLLTAAGAVAKARRDKVRLDTELATGAGLIKRLREETATTGKPPTRIASSKLRELALQHAETKSALRQIEESEDDLAQRRALAAATDEAPLRDLSAIVAAVDVARALGADADARCMAASRKAELAAAALEQALARLAPWTGDAGALAALARITQVEIDEARTGLADLAAEVARETGIAVRAREEAAALALQIEQLSSGMAISADEIAAVRAERSARWQPLRESVLSGAVLPSPDQSVADFEATIAQADERSDLRFAAADESSRLADMTQRRARLLLEAEQAKGRATTATARGEALRSAWAATMTKAGYPALEPARFIGWLGDRDVAVAAARDATSSADDARTMIGRRDAVRVELAASLGAEAGTRPGVELAPLLAIAERIRSDGEKAVQQRRLTEAAALQMEQDAEALRRRRARIEEVGKARANQWGRLLAETGISLDIEGAIATIDALDELRSAIGAQAELQARVDGMVRDAANHESDVALVADALGIAAMSDVDDRLTLLRDRLAAARAAASATDALKQTIASRSAEILAETAKIEAAMDTLRPLMEETGSQDLAELGSAIERSKSARALREAAAAAETAIKAAGDSKSLDDLLGSLAEVDVDGLAARSQTLAADLADRNEDVARAAAAHGDAKRVLANLETDVESAAGAASDAEQARAELGILSEQFILKRAQVVTLRWAIEQYRERHQDPMLLRAGQIFQTLTNGRYVALRIDNDGTSPRLLGLRDDGRTVIEIGAMSEGTTDQLFLALRLAAVEQSIAAGVRLPFLADDLFVNFDDERAEAGFRVLAELSRATQVLFFTHHPHLAAIARSVVGAGAHSECSLT